MWEDDEAGGGLDVLDMDTDQFGDWNDDGELFDQDLLKHDIEEPAQSLAAAAPPAVATPAPAASAFQQYNTELAAHCGRVGASLTHELGKLGWAQRQLAAGTGGATVPPPQQQQAALAALRGRVETALCDTWRVLSGTILLPAALAALLELREQLCVMQAQAEVFEKELNGGGGCGARLMLLGGSGSVGGRVAKKDSALGAPEVRLRVLTGAMSQLRAGPAELVCEEGAPMAGQAATFDAAGAAVFGEARFAAGSGSKVVRVRGRAAVEWRGAGGREGGKAVLASGESAAFVVTTTEGQWSAAQGKLLAGLLFGGGKQHSVPWPLMANLLQRVYLEGTRQDPSAPSRPLTRTDLTYVHQFKCDSQPAVTAAVFDSFWAWFGPHLMGLRHSRLLLHLWCLGSVMGFISKKAAESLLSGRSPGTFLLRFSERAAGSFAVAYVKQSKGRGEAAVKHYLLQPGDVAPPQRSLADFLGSQSYFVYLLQALPDPAGSADTVRWRVVHKDEAFGPFYGSKGLSFDGYDERIGGDD